MRRGIKSNNNNRFGTKAKPNWDYYGDNIGVAVNVDKGMMTVSTNCNWELTDGNEVKFEVTKIQARVYQLHM